MDRQEPVPGEWWQEGEVTLPAQPCNTHPKGEAMTPANKIVLLERSVNTLSIQRWQVEIPAAYDVVEWQENDGHGFEQYLLDNGLLLEETAALNPVETEIRVLAVNDLQSSSPAQTFAVRLREERRLAGLSQVELARAVSQHLGRSIDGSTLTRIEKGDRSVRIEEALALAQTLGRPLASFLEEAPTPAEGDGPALPGHEVTDLVEAKIELLREYKLERLQDYEPADVIAMHTEVERLERIRDELHRASDRPGD